MWFQKCHFTMWLLWDQNKASRFPKLLWNFDLLVLSCDQNKTRTFMMFFCLFPPRSVCLMRSQTTLNICLSCSHPQTTSRFPKLLWNSDLLASFRCQNKTSRCSMYFVIPSGKQTRGEFPICLSCSGPRTKPRTRQPDVEFSLYHRFQTNLCVWMGARDCPSLFISTHIYIYIYIHPKVR